tara:strand:+ start:657 stop:1670 length:1014 start_codon:yes stop_codon:yes gene_type:complete
MLVCRTPLRISLFGGGTDFPKWYTSHKGITISFTIDKFCYVTLRKLPNLFSFKYRLRYFKTECPKKKSDIKHPSIKAVLKKFDKTNDSFELIHSSDIPGLSGLGSSSAFTASIVNLIHTMNGQRLNKKKIAEKAVYIEREVLKESVGLQDHYACTHGGFNVIEYSKKRISVNPIKMKKNKINYLLKNSILVYTGILREAEPIEKDKLRNYEKVKKNLEEIKNLAYKAKKVLESNSKKYIEDIAELMKQNWKQKKKLSKYVSNKKIEKLYEFGLNNGAICGKLLGAGGGGYILFISKNQNDQKKLLKSLKKKIYFRFKLNNSGTKIIYQSDSDKYDQT